MKYNLDQLLELKHEQYVGEPLNKQLTIREYLRDLLIELLLSGESFSPKRPLGWSGWRNTLRGTLEEAGVGEEDFGQVVSDLVRHAMKSH
jgi:hypothetical protein